MHPSFDDRRILRASDAERDEAVGRLRHHGAVGRLTVDELTDRIDRALDAKTLGQLDELFADLPDERSLAEQPAVPPPVFSAWRTAALWRYAARLILLNLVLLGLWAGDGIHYGMTAAFPFFLMLFSFVAMRRRVAHAARRAERDARRGTARRTPPPPFLGP
ncbi:MAG: DUF1707 domain-containing protein [Actinomycetota bacterium]|nr:DUF1707 domain-containing protein [Actinomycetota bacterium]